MIRFTCPTCAAMLSAPDDCAGRTSKCQCGTTVVVPHAPYHQMPPPDSKDTTTLGQMVAHSPTGLAPDRPSDAGPAPSPDTTKTRVGKVVAHVPTGISKNPIPAAKKTPVSAPPSRPRRPSVSQPAPARAPASRFWLILLLILVPLMFVSGTVFALGLVYFLKSPERSQTQGEQLAKAVEVQEPTSPVALPPTPKEEQPPAPKAAGKKDDAVDLADIIKEKKPAEKKAAILPLELAPVNRPPALPAKIDEEKPAPKAEEKPSPKIEEKPKPAPAPPLAEKQPNKEPPAPTKVADQPAKEKLPADIRALIVKLRTGKNDQKIAAAEALAERGEAASGAARALCETATSPDREVSRGALQALEKVAPQLQEPVFTLIVDGQAANHRKAIAALRRLKEKAKLAMPVVLFEIKKCLADLDVQDQGQLGSIGWGQDTVIDVTDDLLRSIPDIAPEDPDGLKTIMFAGHVTLRRAVVIQENVGLTGKGRIAKGAGPGFPGGFRVITKTPFRSTAVPLLGTVAEKRPELRKVVLPQLGKFLDESVQRLDEHTTKPESKNNPAILEYDFARIISIGEALQKCGPAAKDMVAKKFIPILKDLEFSANDKIRSRAKELRKQIETAPKGGASILRAARFVAQREQMDSPYSIERRFRLSAREQ